MEKNNLKSNVNEEYARDKARFYPKYAIAYLNSLSGTYGIVMFEVERNYKEYRDAFHTFVYMSEQNALEDMSSQFCHTCNLVYFINQVGICIDSFKAFYCYHKTYFVDLHKDEVLQNIKVIVKILNAIQNECNHLSLSESLHRSAPFKYDAADEMFRDINFHATMDVYAHHSIEGVVEPFNGIPPIRKGVPICPDSCIPWAFEGVRRRMVNSSEQRDQLMTALGVMLLQLLRLHNLYMQQLADAEDVALEDFFTPLYHNVCDLFSSSSEESMALKRLKQRFRKLRVKSPVPQHVIDELVDEYNNMLIENEVGKLWEYWAGDVNEFSRSLFINGCSVDDLTRFLSCMACLNLLDNSDELNRVLVQEGCVRGGQNAVSPEDAKRRALEQSNTLFSRVKDGMRVDMLAIYNFVKLSFLPHCEHKYEWVAVYCYLRDYLAVRDFKSFESQMMHKCWFGEYAEDSSKGCTADSIGEYNFIAIEKDPDKWSIEQKHGASRASQRGVVAIRYRYDEMVEYDQAHDFLIGRPCGS